MKVRLALIFPALLILIICIGLACSGGGGSPVEPSDVTAEEPADARDAADAFVGGLWEVAINKSTGEVQVTALRNAQAALNALGFLEPPSLFFLSINLSTLEVDPANVYVGANVILNHPLYSPENKFDGFDVRGIVFGGRVANADGYTPLLRPVDFADVPFGYIDGMIGTPKDWANYDDAINGYKYFADNLTADESVADFFDNPANLAKRGVFSEGATNVRHYDLYFDRAGDQFLVFNYAVLTSYDFPMGVPPFDVDDYPVGTANCAEPFHLDTRLIQNSLYYDSNTGGGGAFSLEVQVYDWQGLGDTEVSIESPGVIPLTTENKWTPGTTSKSGIFKFTGISGTPTQSGPLEIYVKASDLGTTFGESFFLDFLPPSHPLYDVPAYTVSVVTLDVADKPLPTVWAVEGETLVGVSEPHTYSVKVTSQQYPDGPFTYAWEMGDDDPPLYDDGDGGNDGSIDLAFPAPGYYNVDCMVTDPGGGKSSSIAPLLVIASPIPGSVGDIDVVVNRQSNGSIFDNDNITVSWSPVADAAEYALYYDPTPMDGSLDAVFFGGATGYTWIDFTLPADGAAYMVIKARGMPGEAGTEGPPSEGGFVDFEQAEDPASEGSWSGNSIYDYANLKMQRIMSAVYKFNGKFGWYDGIGASTDYQNRYEVFYSDPYPEIANADDFKLEVVHRVYNYDFNYNSEDGYGCGYILETDPTPGLGPGNYFYLYVLSPITGDPYWPNNDAMRDEFTYPMNPDGGFTSTYFWRLSSFNVNWLAWASINRVGIGHATDTSPNSGAFLALDDIAVIIH